MKPQLDELRPSRARDLTLRTDSKYLIDGLAAWRCCNRLEQRKRPNPDLTLLEASKYLMHERWSWKRKGWKTAAAQARAQPGQGWKALDAARLDDVPLRYVKGHSGAIQTTNGWTASPWRSPS